MLCFYTDLWISFVHIICTTLSLPPGEIQIEEDVSVGFSSDFEGFIKQNDKIETGSDIIEESANDFDDEFVNDSDFEGSLTKIPPEEIGEILNRCDIDRSEIINTYTMEGFESSVIVRVENKSAFTYPSVGGKVFKGGRWKSAKNVIVEVLVPFVIFFTYCLIT